MRRLHREKCTVGMFQGFFSSLLDLYFYFTVQSVFTRMAVIKALEKIKEEDFLK